MAIGRLSGSEIVSKGWVFYQKNPSITPDGNIDFYKQSKPLVIYGTPSVITLNVENMKPRTMFVSLAHDRYGQGENYDEFDTEFEASISISTKTDVVSSTNSRYSEVMDVPGMVIKELSSQLVGMGLAGFQNVTAVSQWLEVTQSLLDAGGTAKKHKDVLRALKPKVQDEADGTFHMVTISPAELTTEELRGGGQNKVFEGKEKYPIIQKKGEYGIEIPFRRIARMIEV